MKSEKQRTSVRKLKAQGLLFLLTIVLLNLTSEMLPQMPPHPNLIKRYRSGELSRPAILLKQSGDKASGIDSAWSDSLLSGNQDSLRRFGALTPPSGSWNLLVLLVDFSDKPKIINAGYFDALLFLATGSTLRNYYKEISHGNIDIVTLNSPASTGWIRAPQAYSYYIGGGDNGTGYYPNNCQKLVEDLIDLADPYIDFSRYDNDHNGEVDALMVIHSGKGAEFTGDDKDIWSHAWSLKNRKNCDGVSVYRYSMQPEYYADSTGDMTIGVFAHELGHSAFGLPDLYDTDYSSSGLGYWSLMAGGSWNGNTDVGGDSPAHPDAWSRIQMGFAQVTVMKDNAGNYTINPVEQTGSIIKLSKDGNSSVSEYFLAENRAKTGFDQYIPGSGMLIYHIDEDKTGNDKEWYPGHTTSGHYKVSLIQADNKWELEKGKNDGDASDAFPSSGNNSFTLITSPDSRNYDGSDSKIAATNITVPACNVFVTDKNYSFAFTAPLPGEIWQANSYREICFSSNGSTLLRLDYSTNNGLLWKNIASDIPASTVKYSWKTADVSSNTCQLKLSDASYPSAFKTSPLFSISDSTPLVGYPLPGDLIFTQTGSTDPDIFEFITLKRLNLTTLKITDNGLQSNGVLSSSEGTLDLSQAKYTCLKDVPGGTFVRFERGTNQDDTDTADRILKFNYTTGPLLSTAGDQLIAYTGTSASPLFISAVNFGTSGWITTGAITTNTSYAPQTISDIPLGTKDNYRFIGSISGDASATRSFIKNTAYWEGSNSIFGFTLKNIGDALLPVELVCFSGKYEKEKILLTWQTATEINNYGWEIERKSVGGNWNYIGFVKGSGNSNKNREYWFTDIPDQSVTGSFYRLKQIDNDGKVNEYSDEIEIKLHHGKGFSMEQNYPNPFNSSTVIKYSIPEEMRVSLTIYNLLGEIIIKIKDCTEHAGSYSVNIDLSKSGSVPLQSGVYFYKLQAGNYICIKKFILLR